MTEENQLLVELLKMLSGWFGQITTLSTGLILILIALHEKIFTIRSKKPWYSLLFMAVSVLGFAVAIWYSVGSELFLVGFIPGTGVDAARLNADLIGATRSALTGFALGMGGLIFYAFENILFGRSANKDNLTDTNSSATSTKDDVKEELPKKR